MAAYIKFGPNFGPVEVSAGTSLLAAANRARLPLGQSCRGQGVCNSCRVRVDGGSRLLSPPTALERRWRLAPGWRLACQTRVLGTASSEASTTPPEAIVALWCPAWGV